MSKMDIQHIFIIGSKGIPSQYGGFETFVDRITEYEEEMPYEDGKDYPAQIRYHVACRTNFDQEPYEYHSAECFPIKTPSLGAAAAIIYDLYAIKYVVRYAKDHQIPHPYVYILASRIGPFIAKYVKEIHALGGQVFLNPDGFEWKRGKWPAPVKAYWKMSTKQMVMNSDTIICDSDYIRSYICEHYKSNQVYYIPYGADIETETTHKTRTKYRKWLKDNGLTEGRYFLTVSRLVPENNFETMIREYMASESDMPFALITTVNDDMKEALDARLHYRQDERIMFLPSVYDRELLATIRRGSFGYFHGHEVGGTNPSLLEALAAGVVKYEQADAHTGTVVLALDVTFNREVCGSDEQQGAYYWTKDEGNLRSVINNLVQGQDKSGERAQISAMGVDRIRRIYNWEIINRAYRDVFLGDGTGMSL